MKITNINFRNMKTAYFNSSIKLNNGKSFVSFKSQPAFDRFTGKSSRTEKAIELHNLLNNRVQKPDVIISSKENLEKIKEFIKNKVATL